MWIWLCLSAVVLMLGTVLLQDTLIRRQRRRDRRNMLRIVRYLERSKS